MDKSVQQIYGNQVRTRACGLCFDNDRILLVNHGGLYGHDFWAPPGGGVDFGESIYKTIEREFLEETGITIEVGKFRVACEFILPPLHAIELVFDVIPIKGVPSPGRDPETGNKRIITGVRYFPFDEINELTDNCKHGIFRQARSVRELKALSGYIVMQ